MQKQYLFLLLFCFSIVSKNQIANSTTLPTIESESSAELQFVQEDELTLFFLKPINFDQNGITYYFKHVYNHDKYTEFLPYNFSHLIQFLQFGHTNEQPEQFAKSVIKLFLQKIKACNYINGYNLLEMMPKFAESLQPYVEKKKASFFQELQRSLKKRLTDVFSQYFTHFKKNPDAFLEALAEQKIGRAHV